MSKIFIALATYNGEKYLELFLRSLINQSLKADQIIVVDDASIDSSVSILKNFSFLLPLKIIIHQKNQGHLLSFEHALEEIKKQSSPGDLIALADQDDIWLPNKLLLLNQQIENADLIYGDAQIINSNGKIIASSWRRYASISSSQPFLAHIAGINHVTGCLSLFKADLLDVVLPIPEGVSVHDRWIALLAEKRNGIKAFFEPVAQYRIHENNAVGNKKESSMEQTLLVNIAWLKMILNQKEHIPLTSKEYLFTKRLLALQEKRLNKPMAPSYLFWVWHHRNTLFFNTPSLKQKLQKTIFSVLGLSFAKRFLGKSS